MLTNPGITVPPNSVYRNWPNHSVKLPMAAYKKGLGRQGQKGVRRGLGIEGGNHKTANILRVQRTIISLRSAVPSF